MLKIIALLIKVLNISNYIHIHTRIKYIHALALAVCKYICIPQYIYQYIHVTIVRIYDLKSNYSLAEIPVINNLNLITNKLVLSNN